MKKIILASKSPRRKELLSLCGYPFEVMSKDVDESIDHTAPLDKEIEKLAIRKARAVFDDNPDCIVIGSDTIVTIDNKVLGKPHTEDNATVMLKELSGKPPQVITGVAILTEDKVISFANTSTVWFNELDDEEIKQYVESGEPLDKAGAYGIQGKAGCFVSRIDGDYYSIMGLPLSQVYTELRKLVVE